MIKIEKDKLVFSLSKSHIPAARVAAGETVIFETVDCFKNLIMHESQDHSALQGEYANPATGPLFVEGAEVGDILKIEILDIKVADYGVMLAAPDNEILKGRLPDERTKVMLINEGYGIFNEHIKLPICPMIGVIGVAPEGEEISTVSPGAHGGNMDCKKISKGGVLYLPVNTKGALLAMGDLHAIMGDGETGGCGLEVAGEVTVKVDVVKGKQLPLPMLIQDKKLMTIASEKTMDLANQLAVLNMHEFLTKELGMDAHEAGFLISLAGDLKVCQIVDPLLTARMEISMDILEKYNYKMA